MEVINDSLKNVAKSKELIKTYLEIPNLDSNVLLTTAFDLLDETIHILSEATSKRST